jgi:hypothetical protein
MHRHGNGHGPRYPAMHSLFPHNIDCRDAPGGAANVVVVLVVAVVDVVDVVVVRMCRCYEDRHTCPGLCMSKSGSGFL